MFICDLERVKRYREHNLYDGGSLFLFSYTGFGDVTSVMQVDTGSGVAGMPYRCIALVPGQKIEHAPYLVEYVTIVGLPCK